MPQEKPEVPFREIGLLAREICPEAFARQCHRKLPDFKEVCDMREKALIEAAARLGATI